MDVAPTDRGQADVVFYTCASRTRPRTNVRDVVAVVGAEDMGYGLAAYFALHVVDVMLVDQRQSNLDRIEDVVVFLREEDETDRSPSSRTTSSPSRNCATLTKSSGARTRAG